MTEYVYIHIPFCKQKCRYCSFVSFPATEYIKKYLTAISKEIKHNYKNEKLETLYIGGGTPSLLSPDELNILTEFFNISEKTEYTIEMNPENINLKYLQELKKIGVNRISIGCQTFDNNILKIIGRRHNNQDVINAVHTAQNAGFKNISIDLIYGLPTQTINIFEQDLKQAVNLGISHISLYGLKIEESCDFYYNKPAQLPDEDIQADMFIKAIELLEKNNFEHYEISNFSKKGFESKHNLNYWNNNQYYGFGTAAHGYIDGIRYSNKKNLKEYIQNPLIHEENKKLSKEEQLQEEIFLGFRRIKGINTELINKKYSIDFEDKYKSIISKYIDTGHLIKTKNGYKLSDNGILISNYILADFI